MKILGHCRLCPITFALVTATVFILMSTPSARPQSDADSTEAKKHYQNAVTAIGKNDWQTARAELLQAEKLAPNNALVHYDLALAYSHSGQPKSAQAELNKALQIGLPAEQKQAAEQLRQQLASQSAVPKATSGVNASAANSKGPTVAETLDWIKAKLQSEASVDISTTPTPVNNYTVTGVRSFKVERVEGCELTVLDASDFTQTFASGRVATSHVRQEVQVDLSRSRSDVSVKFLTTPPEYNARNFWSVIIYPQDTFASTVTVDDGAKKSTTLSEFNIPFPGTSQDIATRVGKALSDAIVKCGGKRVKEIY
jgi:hypothetical protein